MINLLIILFCLVSCTRHPGNETAKSLVVENVVVQVPKDDSVVTLDFQIKNLDSLRATSAYASDLYLLTLDNFLEVGGKDERLPEITIWKANHLYNRNAFKEALALYQKFQQKYPDSKFNGEAGQMIAQCYAQLGQNDKAEAFYRGLLTQGDVAVRGEAQARVAQTLYLQAESAEKNGDLKKASDIYARVANEFPTVEISPVALFNAGVLQEKIKDWNSAIALYHKFFDAYYSNNMLPKVLFREAKCFEQLSIWDSVAQKYTNLARAFPKSPEAELAAYNAGFAFANALKQKEAALAFENYAKQFPDKSEAPNLLFRAAEMYGELKAWDKVGELQGLFAKRYASDKTRLIQALCMGGMAAFQQEHFEEAKRLLENTLAEFFKQKSMDPNSRYYAAQAQHTLAEMEWGNFLKISWTDKSNNFEAVLKNKTQQMKKTVSAYLHVFDLKIVDWSLRSANSLGNAFGKYAIDIYEAPRKAIKKDQDEWEIEADTYTALINTMGKAQDQFAQVLALAEKQDVHNIWVDQARQQLGILATQLINIHAQVEQRTLKSIHEEDGNSDKAIANALKLAGRVRDIAEISQGYYKSYLDIAAEVVLDSEVNTKVSVALLNSSLSLGQSYLKVVTLARGANIPKNFQAMESFYYKAKLLQEGLPKFEKVAIEYLRNGLELAELYGLEDSLRINNLKKSLGEELYTEAYALDLLGQEALLHPPMPEKISEVEKKTYSEKLENTGYQLQDKAIEKYKQIVDLAMVNKVDLQFAKKAFARLYQVEPDKWSNDDKPIYPWNSEYPSMEEIQNLRNDQPVLPNFPPVLPVTQAKVNMPVTPKVHDSTKSVKDSVTKIDTVTKSVAQAIKNDTVEKVDSPIKVESMLKVDPVIKREENIDITKSIIPMPEAIIKMDTTVKVDTLISVDK